MPRKRARVRRFVVREANMNRFDEFNKSCANVFDGCTKTINRCTLWVVEHMPALIVIGVVGVIVIAIGVRAFI